MDYEPIETLNDPTPTHRVNHYQAKQLALQHKVLRYNTLLEQKQDLYEQYRLNCRVEWSDVFTYRLPGDIGVLLNKWVPMYESENAGVGNGTGTGENTGSGSGNGAGAGMGTIVSGNVNNDDFIPVDINTHSVPTTNTTNATHTHYNSYSSDNRHNTYNRYNSYNRSCIESMPVPTKTFCVVLAERLWMQSVDKVQYVNTVANEATNSKGRVSSGSSSGSGHTDGFDQIQEQVQDAWTDVNTGGDVISDVDVDVHTDTDGGVVVSDACNTYDTYNTIPYPYPYVFAPFKPFQFIDRHDQHKHRPSGSSGGGGGDVCTFVVDRETVEVVTGGGDESVCGSVASGDVVDTWADVNMDSDIEHDSECGSERSPSFVSNPHSESTRSHSSRCISSSTSNSVGSNDIVSDSVSDSGSVDTVDDVWYESAIVHSYSNTNTNSTATSRNTGTNTGTSPMNTNENYIQLSTTTTTNTTTSNTHTTSNVALDIPYSTHRRRYMEVNPIKYRIVNGFQIPLYNV